MPCHPDGVFLGVEMENAKIAAALVKAQKAFGPALKTSTNPHFRSRYADLAACVEAVMDGLSANGIFFTQKVAPSESGVLVETVFIHESGETLSCGQIHVPASKHDAQGFGSALTYARRYSLMAACGIAPEDDDGNAASKRGGAEDEKFEQMYLDKLREAAMNGLDALATAFKEIPNTPAKSRVWAKHQASLKQAAQGVKND